MKTKPLGPAFWMCLALACAKPSAKTPAAGDALFDEARRATHEGRYPEAHQLLDQLDQRQPSHPGRFTARGDLYAVEGRSDEACAAYRQNLSTNGLVDASATNQLVYMAGQDVAAAPRCALSPEEATMAALRPGVMSSFLTAQQQNSYDSFWTVLAEAQRSAPRDPLLYDLEGQAHQARGELARACTAYQSSIALAGEETPNSRARRSFLEAQDPAQHPSCAYRQGPGAVP